MTVDMPIELRVEFSSAMSFGSGGHWKQALAVQSQINQRSTETSSAGASGLTRDWVLVDNQRSTDARSAGANPATFQSWVKPALAYVPSANFHRAEIGGTRRRIMRWRGQRLTFIDEETPPARE